MAIFYLVNKNNNNNNKLQKQGTVIKMGKTINVFDFQPSDYTTGEIFLECKLGHPNLSYRKMISQNEKNRHAVLTKCLWPHEELFPAIGLARDASRDPSRGVL